MLKRLATLLPLLFFLAACSPAPKPEYKGTDISGADFGRQLNLTDHNGVRRSLADFRGKLIVLFFGYTHCPDVCPTTLADVARALAELGPDQAARVQVLFVSVDPERDTPAMLKAYVPYFHPAFLGLHGSPEEVAAAAKEFRIVYRRHVEAGASGYLVDHTAGSYVLDGKGRLRLFLPFAQPAPDIAHDLRLLLAEG
jgi:protein SCO1/2